MQLRFRVWGSGLGVDRLLPLCVFVCVCERERERKRGRGGRGREGGVRVLGKGLTACNSIVSGDGRGAGS